MPQDLVDSDSNSKNISSETDGLGRRRSHQGDGPTDLPTDGPIDLPLVIRPKALRLAEVERRLRSDVALARAVFAQPEFSAILARAILQRDPLARARFADIGELAAHLRAVRAG